MNPKKLFKHFILILALGLVIGLASNSGLIKRYFRGEFRHSFLSREEYPSITFIGLAEADDLFSKGEALFIDSRAEEDFREGHIPGAVNIPFAEHREEEAVLLTSLPLDRTLVVYCDGSECQSSVALAKLLHKKGFRQIKVFFGGWVEWVKQGLPLESEK